MDEGMQIKKNVKKKSIKTCNFEIFIVNEVSMREEDSGTGESIAMHSSLERENYGMVQNLN